MTKHVEKSGLAIAEELVDLVGNEITPGTGIDADAVWEALAGMIEVLAPRNRALLQRRDDLQAEIDAWHLERKGQPLDAEAYKAFLTEIGYLEAEGEDFAIGTANVDAEIAVIAGPQLVVPVMNARYALNAANARWGSFYDALYGTDAISEADGCERSGGYNAKRGAKVIDFANSFLDQAAPLAAGGHGEAVAYRLADGDGGKVLLVEMADGGETGLRDPAQFVGYTGGDVPDAVLLKNNNLHIEIQIDRNHPVGKDDPAARRMSFWRPPSRPFRTAKIRLPPWMPRTRRWSTAIGSA